MASAVATPLERQFGRIASVSEMTSSSQLSSTAVMLQFDLIATSTLPLAMSRPLLTPLAASFQPTCPSNPGYWKANPADAPILMLALSSDLVDRAHMYDFADSILAQKLSQIEGVGQVEVFGSSRPAVRVQVNPTLLNNMGLGLTDVATTLQNANAHQAKGTMANQRYRWQVNATDQLFEASEYARLIVPIATALRFAWPILAMLSIRSRTP